MQKNWKKKLDYVERSCSILLLLSKHKTKKKGNLWNHSTTDKAKMPEYMKHAVPEIIQTPTTDGIRMS